MFVHLNSLTSARTVEEDKSMREAMRILIQMNFYSLTNLAVHIYSCMRVLEAHIAFRAAFPLKLFTQLFSARAPVGKKRLFLSRACLIHSLSLRRALCTGPPSPVLITSSVLFRCVGRFLFSQSNLHCSHFGSTNTY